MKIRLLLFLCLAFLSFGNGFSQSVYTEDFGSNATVGLPYVYGTNATGSATKDANFTNPSWNQTNASANFAGVAGGSMSATIAASGGSNVITCTFNVAAGFQLTPASIVYNYRISSTGATKLDSSISGTTGTTSNIAQVTTTRSGAFVGATTSNFISPGALTGTITLVLNFSTTTGTNSTIRVDNITINGVVSAVGGAPTISSALTGSVVHGSAYSYTIVASNTPTSYNATSLPAGLSVNTTTGAISGTPTAGAAGSPYNISISATNGSGTDTKTLVLTITPKALTISGLTADNKVYDRTTTATLSGTGSLVGIVGGDAVTLSGTPAPTFANFNVGTAKAVTVTGYTLSGAQAANYTLTQPAGLTANITAKPLTVSGITANNKVYDGTTAATLSGGSLVGVIGGDTVTLGQTGTFASANVGTAIAVTSTCTLGGGSAANYSLTQPTGLSANITQATQTITFNALAAQVVGAANFNLTATSTSGLTITYTSSNPAVATVSGNTVTIVGAGTTVITASQAGNANYAAATNVTQNQVVNTAPCLGENFAVNALPSGWAQTTISFTSNYAEFAGNNGDLATIAVSNPTSLTFTLARTSNATAKDMIVEVSTTSQTTGFSTVTTYDHSNTVSNSTTNCTVDLSAYTANATVYIRFRKVSGTTSPWRLDDINVYCGGTTPTITLSPATLTGMTYSFGSGPSANQTFTASGVNLTADILLTPPTNYEISTAAGSGFGSTITLTQTAGTVNATTIYVRLKAGLAVNTYNTENIAGTSAGATTKNVVCSGSVTVPAAANNLCGNATVLTVNATATAGNMTGSTVTAPFTVEKDVWYSFTPTCTGIHTITVTGFTGDIDIELFAGTCPASTTTLDGSAGTTSTETISTSLTSGTTYSVRVLAYNVAAETTAFTAQVLSASVLTLTNTGSPAAGNIPAGTANAVIMGFTTTPTCATSYDLTAVTLTKSAISTVTTADISGFRIFYDANSNGIVDGAEASISGAGIALATTMNFTLSGQTGITTARKYLLVANILAGAVNGNTIKVNLSPNTDLTQVLTPAGTKTGTALGNTQTITPPACTSAVIASVTPASGPVGTEVTITASSGTLTGATATFNGVAATVVSSSATQLVVIVPTGAATGNLVVTDGQPCNATTTFTVINNDITTCQGAGNSFTDLIISEVYDSLAGNVWHMELFNPTNAAINLDAVGANYRIERYGTIGDAAPTRTVDISGIIQPGAVWLADLGTITDPSCIKTFDFTSYAQGINEQDAIKLTKEGVSVDIVHCPNEKGYTIKRITTASGPNPVFTAGDWNTISSEDCTDLGLFSAALNVPPTITAQPSINLTCSSTSAAVTVTATEGFGGGNPLAYQWYVAAPGAATWTALTNTGVYTGATASVLNISAIAGLENYQYYCQVRENGAGCYKASIAVKIPASTVTTWNGTAWSNGTPTLAKLTIINGNYNTTTNGDIDACSLLVKTGYTTTVTANHYINIQNDLTVEAGGTLDVLNNGSLVQVSDTGVNTGTILMKRTANIRLYDYVYWSAPVANFAVTSVSPSSPTGTIFKWNPTVANSNGGFGNWENTTENMITAKGYIIRGPNGFNNTAPQAMTANFSGVPHNGIYTPSIIRGNNQAADYLGTNGITITNKEDNWNLVGNPYPSAIKSLDFLATNTNIEGAVRVWTHGTLPNAATPNPFYGSFSYNYTATDYIVHNGTATTSGPAGFNGLIAAGQSFLVLMNDGPGATQTVTFNNALRSKTYDNSQFFKNADGQKSVGGIERHRIWLDLISPTNVINRVVIGYVEGATDQKDRMYDAYTDYKNAQNFYSLINDEVMIIQGKSLPFKVEDRVPMGIKVPSNGTYQIAIAAVDGLFSGGGQTIYLEDLLLNVIHNLSVAPYQFTTTQGIINNRFVIRYNDAALGNDNFEIIQNGVTVAAQNHEIHIKSQLEPMKNISVYDVLGRLVFEKKNINNTQFTIQNMVVSQQALIVKILLENGQTVSKKIVF